MQIPVAVGATMYEAHGLATGKKVLSSKGSQQNALKSCQLFVYCQFGIIAGLVGGLLGVGGGFIMGPLFLELGIPPQVYAPPYGLFGIEFHKTFLEFSQAMLYELFYYP